MSLETDIAPAAPADAPDEFAVPVQGMGQWALIWYRFTRHRLAVIGFWVALAIILVALLGPLVAPPLPTPDASGDVPLAVYNQRNMPPALSPWQHLMGTDQEGGPVLTYVLIGGRPILAIGIFGALLASLLGILVGGVAGYLRGPVDALLMRLVDAFLAVPFLLFLVLISRYPVNPAVPPTVVSILEFGLVGWAGVARLVRGYVLSLRQREYADAARALGVSPGGIIARHLLPNALDVIVVSFTLNVAVFMIAEVTLEYLGAGTGGITWGSLLPAGVVFDVYWWQWAFPGAALLLSVLSVNFLGDGLRDALDTTSQTALVAARPRREAGRMARVARVVGQRAGSFWRMAALARQGLDLPGKSRGVVGRVVPRAARDWARAEQSPAAASSPLWRLGPPAAAFLVVGIVFLYGHSPLTYSPHYNAPTTLGSVLGPAEYGAIPQQRGTLDVLAVDGQEQVTFQRFDAAGRVVRRQALGPGDGSSRPALGQSAGRLLGAWVSDGQQVIRAAYLDGPRPRPFTLVRQDGGLVEHPWVAALPRGGFAILFDGQLPGRSSYDLFLATLAPGARQPVLHRLIGHGGDVVYPRAIRDGNGGLEVFYLQQVDPDHGFWQLRRRRFSPGGQALSRPQSLGRISYLDQTPGGFAVPVAPPAQWALDVKRARDGSVWAAGEIGDVVVSQSGVAGSTALVVGHWSRAGRTLLPPRVVDPAFDAAGQAVALTLRRNGGNLYYPAPGPVETYLLARPFDQRGLAGAGERVNYDGGGGVANPRARTIRGRPVVLWQKVPAGAASFLEFTRFHPAQPPNLLTHLGLNVGNLWSNLALLLFGSLAAGIGLSVINIFLLLPLVPVWMIVRRLLPGTHRWIVFLAAIAVLLAAVFALPEGAPGVLLVVPSLVGALGALYGWLAVAGAVLVSGWIGHYLLARRDSAFRATAMALLGLYFVMVMEALIYIEQQIGQI